MVKKRELPSILGLTEYTINNGQSDVLVVQHNAHGIGIYGIEEPAWLPSHLLDDLIDVLQSIKAHGNPTG